MQLTKGIFDRSVPRGEQPLFGLSTSQMRGNEIVHNGGWYNLAGEKLGWGDLAARDFVRILVEIPHGEAFIVLGEGASHWDFLRDFGGKPEAMALDPAAPGIDYVLEHMRWVIVSGSAAKASFAQARGSCLAGTLPSRNSSASTRSASAQTATIG